MSALDKKPLEVVTGDEVPSGGIRVLEPRDVPLGGPRAMTVRRTLPQRSRSLIGAWCFVDHYGPDEVADSGGMVVPPHPHTGLQTVSWLFDGEVEHRDSAGNHAMVRPGELNLMTAGNGIAHSEVSTAATTRLHGVQLWVALPDAHRFGAPGFEHFVPQPARVGDAALRVFLGTLAGSTSPVITYSGLVGTQIDLPAEASVKLDVDPAFEHGLLIDLGAATLDGVDVRRGELGLTPHGAATLEIAAGAEPLRGLLLGGEPFGERIVMWWNFIGRTHEEIVQFREQWQADVLGDERADGRFGFRPRLRRCTPSCSPATRREAQAEGYLAPISCRGPPAQGLSPAGHADLSWALERVGHVREL